MRLFLFLERALHRRKKPLRFDSANDYVSCEFRSQRVPLLLLLHCFGENGWCEDGLRLTSTSDTFWHVPNRHGVNTDANSEPKQRVFFLFQIALHESAQVVVPGEEESKLAYDGVITFPGFFITLGIFSLCVSILVFHSLPNVVACCFVLCH